LPQISGPPLSTRVLLSLSHYAIGQKLQA